MPSLLELQRGLRDALLAGAPAPEWLAGVAGHAGARLEIYRNTIDATLVRALRLAFPTVERLVGPEFFEGAAQLYSQAHPPVHADLDEHGEGFPQFLQQFPPCSGLAYLPDVARLDGAVCRALHADDAEPLDPRALAGIEAGQVGALQFRFHPSVRLLRSEFPVDTVWAAVLARDEAAMAAIDLHAGPVHLLVQRRDGQAVVARMAPPHWAWTRALADGRPFGDLLAPTTTAEVAAVLAQHLDARRIVAFRLASLDEDLQ